MLLVNVPRREPGVHAAGEYGAPAGWPASSRRRDHLTAAHRVTGETHRRCVKVRFTSMDITGLANRKGRLSTQLSRSRLAPRSEAKGAWAVTRPSASWPLSRRGACGVFGTLRRDIARRQGGRAGVGLIDIRSRSGPITLWEESHACDPS